MMPHLWDSVRGAYTGAMRAQEETPHSAWGSQGRLPGGRVNKAEFRSEIELGLLVLWGLGVRSEMDLWNGCPRQEEEREQSQA